MFNNIYNNKRVLVTGHTGFKGSWLCLWLKELGAEVIGFSNEVPTSPSHFELLGLTLKDLRGDIREASLTEKIIVDVQPDIVFHLAAQPIVRLSYSTPKQTFDTNVMGLINVLEGVRKSKATKACINITSDKCYENREIYQGYREDDPMGGRDPYSASKGCAELVTAAYRKSFFEKEDKLLASVRAGNVIGGGDWASDRLIPDVFRAVENNTSVIIRNPNSIRPWQHVLEPLYGYLSIGEKLLSGASEYADGWNFGPEEEDSRTVIQVIEEMKKSFDRIEYSVEGQHASLHEAGILKLNIDKAKEKLLWKPIWHFEKTIKMTVEWYKYFYTQHHSPATNFRERSLADLRDFLRDINS